MLAKRQGGAMNFFRRILCFGLVLTLSISGCAGHSRRSSGSSTSVPPLRSFSPEEIQTGYQIHTQILSSFYTYTDPRLVEYVNEIGTELLGDSLGKDELKQYRFTILYNDRIYATSAPGGFIYVTTGLINVLDDETQLAAVLAEEIGLLQFQDARLSETRRRMDAVTNGVAVVAPMFGQFGMLAVLGVLAVNAIADRGTPAGNHRLLRADELAMHYMVDAGYDPQGFLNLMHKLVALDQKDIPNFFDYYQSHPITEERYTNMNRVFSELPLEGRTFTVERQKFLEVTKGIRDMYAPQSPPPASV